MEQTTGTRWLPGQPERFFHLAAAAFLFASCGGRGNEADSSVAVDVVGQDANPAEDSHDDGGALPPQDAKVVEVLDFEQMDDQSISVELQLVDLQPSVKGDYGVATVLDLWNGLPDAPLMTVGMLFEDLKGPVGMMLQLFCLAAEDSKPMEDFCGYLFWSPYSPGSVDLTPYGEIVALILGGGPSILDSGMGTEWAPKKNFDPEKMLSGVRLLSDMKIEAEPAGGVIPQGKVAEVWHAIALKKAPAPNCDPDDADCGLVVVPFSTVPGLGPVSATGFDIEVTPKNEYQQMEAEIGEHAVDLRLGSALCAAIEKTVLPMIDYSPGIDSFEEFFGSRFGGEQCLALGNCCQEFAEAVVHNTSGITEQLVLAACEDFMKNAPKYIRKRFADLDQYGGMTVSSAEPCQLSDVTSDMVIDKWGTDTNPCVWKALLNLGGDPFYPAATFKAVSK